MRRKLRWRYVRSTGYYQLGDEKFDHAHVCKYTMGMGNKVSVRWYSSHIAELFDTLKAAKKATEKAVRKRWRA